MSIQSTPSPAWIPDVSRGTKLRIIRQEYARRTGRHLSQEAFAALLNSPAFQCGASKYKAWEADRSNPRDEIGLATRLHDVTGCDPVWFAGIDTWSNPTGGGNVVIPFASPKGPDVANAQFIYTARHLHAA